MVENNGKEDQWKAAFRLKGISIGGKQGLWRKETSCKWLTTEENTSQGVASNKPSHPRTYKAWRGGTIVVEGL